MAEYSDRELVEQILMGVSREDSAGGSEPRRLLTRGDGTLEVWVTLVGRDPNNEPTPVNIDSAGAVVVALGVAWQDIDPVEIPNSEGDLWDPGGLAATIIYEVEFNVVNNDAGSAAVTVSVGLDLARGGSLAAPEYWMFNEIINYPSSSGWRGPFIMHGDDQIRGIASAANDASIHFRVKRVD